MTRKLKTRTRRNLDDSTVSKKSIEEGVEEIRHYPIFMLTLSFFQVVIFYNFRSTELESLLEFKYSRRYEIWRYVTLMLVHDGPIHLWGNILSQMLCGVYLERIHGWKRTSIVFLSGVIFGEIMAGVTSPDWNSCGASSGIWALMMAYYAAILMNPHHFGRVYFTLMTLNGVSEIIRVLYNIEFYLHGELFDNASTLAHSGGAISGVLVGISVVKITRPPKPWQICLRRYSIVAAFVLLLLCLL